MQASVWQQVHEQLDPLLLKPALRPDVVVQRLESRDHHAQYMAKSPQAGTYVRLTERDSKLLELMDGTRTVKQIVLADFVASKSLAYNRVMQLVMLLHTHSFLQSRWIPTYDLVQQQLRANHGLRARAKELADVLFGRQISIQGIDGLVTKLYRSGGWVLLTWPMLVLWAIISVVGFVAFARERGSALPLGHVLAGDGWLGLLAASAAFLGVSILIHELSHALTCKSFGREVRRGGFLLFFGFPAFFVDTTDIWMETRWKRIAVSAAGACADIIVAGLCTLVALVLPPGPAGLMLAFAAMTYGIVLINLCPLLELDGYYVLLDLLQTPNLRPRSFAFLRESLLGKVRRWERFSREEAILTVFGVLAAGYTAFFLIRILQFWNSSIGEFLTEAFRGGSPSAIAIAVLVTAFLVLAVMVKVLSYANGAVRVADHGARILLGAARHAHLRPRAQLLRHIPMLADFSPVQLDAIAAEMTPRKYRQCATIVRQGNRGDRFFVIIHGSVEVLRSSAESTLLPQPTATFSRVATLGPGDYFGERALLDCAPRNATIRALTTVEVLELSADEFDNLVASSWQLKERMHQAAGLREAVESIPLLQDLSPVERDLFISRLREDRFVGGEAIIHQGDVGDRFYMIREGRVRVLRAEPDEDERIVAELGPGDYFGELALLYATRRDASVVAQTEVAAWSLDARDFDDVLRHYLGQDDVLQATARVRVAETEGTGPTAAIVST